jgi:hypothetical protein
MGIDAGPILVALMLGVLLAAGVAWFVAKLYQRRMVALMRAGPAPDDHRAVGESPEVMAPPRTTPVLDAEANRYAMGRQLVAWSLLCLLMGLTHSWLALIFVYPGDSFSATRLVVLGLVYTWPVVMAWGLLRRWAWGQVVLGVGVYMTLMAVVVMLTSAGDQTLAGVAGWLGGVVAIPVVITLLIGASGRIRAVAPYLLPLFVLLAAASVYALNALAGGLDYEPDWLALLLDTVGVWGTLLLVALAPWLVLAWPVYALARWLAAAYRRKRFSDLGYLFAAYWMVVLVASALPGLQAAGAASLTQLLPWLWIPLAALVLPGWLAPSGSPPTLLVLRVFQRDAGVQALFDRVVERWRLSGNTLLIAGTDLVSRTLDPDDLFTFINRRLASRFIANGAELDERLRGFDLTPDPDGRYRVNECYCFDSTWKAALAALVREADVVLMDLRGFRAENLGCRHELRVLSGAGHPRRVVLLHDSRTARDVAEADTADAPSGRFVWIEAGRLNRSRSDQVLLALFGGADAAALGQ